VSIEVLPDAPEPGRVEIHHADNLTVTPAYADGSFALVYLDPPFNTGRTRSKAVESATWTPPVEETEDAAAPDTVPEDPASVDDPNMLTFPEEEPPPPPVVQRGFHGREYARLRGDLRTYDDRFDDYWGFLEPRLIEAWRLLADDGTLYLHLDYREVHYAKVMCDALFGRDKFLNELIWAYDYGAKTKRRWPTKHETILMYVKNPATYFFDSDAVDREPYMAPGLVTAEKAARGKMPTDVWWHTIVPTTGREKTGYPTQKPEGVLRRMVQASSRPGDRVLDMFAGSGTLGAVAAPLGRDSVLIDDNADAVAVMHKRLEPFAG